MPMGFFSPVWETEAKISVNSSLFPSLVMKFSGQAAGVVNEGRWAVRKGLSEEDVARM